MRGGWPRKTNSLVGAYICRYVSRGLPNSFFPPKEIDRECPVNTLSRYTHSLRIGFGKILKDGWLQSIGSIMAGRRLFGLALLGCLEGCNMKTAYIVLPPTPKEHAIPFNAEFCQSFMRDQLRAVKTFFPMDSKITCGDMLDWVPDVDQIILIRPA